MLDEKQQNLVSKLCPTCGASFDSSAGPFCPNDETLLAPLLSDPLVGSTICERYEVQELIGLGGWGRVYKCWDRSLKRVVAAKTLLEQYASFPDRVRRFQQEAEAASSLHHTNICPVYDFGLLPGGQPYLIMEFLDGRTLSEVIRGEFPLAESRVVAFAQQILDALKTAHSAGIVHRDLKPSNIIVTTTAGDEVVKIVDFGLAKLVDARAEDGSMLTTTGETLGTPMYMSPEQCEGRKVDQRSDIYSVGCIVYEMLAGKPAFAGDTMFNIMYRQLSENPPSFASTKINVSQQLEALIFKALEKSPEKRWQSAFEMRARLDSIDLKAKRSAITTLASTARKNAKPLAATLAVLACTVTGLLVFSSTLQSPKQPATSILGGSFGKQPSTALIQEIEQFNQQMNRGDFLSAQKSGALVVAHSKQELGPNHPLTAEGIRRMGVVMKELGQHDNAIALLEESLRSAETSLRPQDLIIPITDLGKYCFEQHQYAKAEFYLHRALTLRRSLPGAEQDPVTVAASHWRAISLQKQGKTEEAKEAYKQLVPLAKANMPASHPFLQQIIQEDQDLRK